MAQSATVVRMNDAVRAALNARLRERGISQTDLARQLGVTPSSVSRALTGGKGGGTVPPLWAAMLEAAGMTLTAVPVERAQGGGELERELGRAVLETLGKHAQAVTAPPEGEEGQR